MKKRLILLVILFFISGLVAGNLGINYSPTGGATLTRVKDIKVTINGASSQIKSTIKPPYKDASYLGFSHNVGGHQVMLYNIYNNIFYTTKDGKAWPATAWKNPSPDGGYGDDWGTTARILGLSSIMPGNLAVTINRIYGFYLSNGDITGDGYFDWLNIPFYGFQSNSINFGYTHNIGGSYVILWEPLYSSRGQIYHAYTVNLRNNLIHTTGDTLSLFGQYLPNELSFGYSHSIGGFGTWVLLWDDEGNWYSSNNGKDWKTGKIYKEVLGSSEYGQRIIPWTGFVHKIGGKQEVVLIEADGDTITTQDGVNWIFNDI